MIVTLKSRQGKSVAVDMKVVPRTGDEIHVTDSDELYPDDVDFMSPVWIVERVQWFCEPLYDVNRNIRFQGSNGVFIFIKNEEE